MIAIIDYGVGNIHSVISALNKLKIENVLTSDPEVIKNADDKSVSAEGKKED